jgi:hypothetical protein
MELAAAPQILAVAPICLLSEKYHRRPFSYVHGKKKMLSANSTKRHFVQKFSCLASET